VVAVDNPVPKLAVTVLARTSVMNLEIQQRFYSAMSDNSSGAPRRLRGSVMNTGSKANYDSNQGKARHTVATSALTSSGMLGQLRVSVTVAAAKIFLKDLKKCDAFVKFFWDGNLFGSTTVKRQTLEPQWDSHNSFSIGVPLAESTSAHLLRVEVWNRDYHTEDHLIGTAKFNSKEIFGEKGKTQEYQLWGDDVPTNGTDPTGAVAMSIRAIRSNSFAEKQ